MATEHDKVDSGALATLVVVGVFATLSVALGVDALYRSESTKVSATRAGSASYAVHALVKEQRAALDAQPMPIERAMSAVVLDLQRNPWSATPPMPEKDAGADAATEEAADASADAAATDAAPAVDGMGNPIPANAPTAPAAPTTAPPVPAAPTTAAPATAAPRPPAPTPAAPAPTEAKPKAPTTPVAPTPAAPASPKPAAPTPATPPAPTTPPAPAPPHG